MVGADSETHQSDWSLVAMVPSVVLDCVIVVTKVGYNCLFG
jgi:hypothetical protein